MDPIGFASEQCTDPQCVAHVAQLVAAVEHRDVIGMAKGLLMASRNCSDSEAIAFLRSSSQHTNVKLWQVATDVVAEHHRDLGPDPGPSAPR